MKGKNSKEKIEFKRNFSLYFKMARPYGFLMLLIVFVVSLIEISRLAEKLLFKVVIDKGTEFTAGTFLRADLIRLFFVLALIYAVVIIVKTAGHWLQIHWVNRVDAGIIFDLKKKFFNHIVGLDHNFHTTHKTGSMISRLGRGAGAVENMTDFLMFSFAPVILQFIFIGGTLIYFDLATAVSVALTTIVFIAYSFYLIYIQQTANLEANASEDREKGFIGDVFTNIDSVKYYGKENVIWGKYEKLSGNSKKLSIISWDYYRHLESGQSFILAVGTFFIVYFPLIRFLNGTMTIGTIAFIYTAYGGLMGPLFGLMSGIRRFYKSIGDFQYLFDYDKMTNQIEDKPNAPKLDVKNGEVEFNNINFTV